MVIFMESSPKHFVEIHVLIQVVKTYTCLIGRERNSPSHGLYLYFFKNVQQTHINILLEMKSAQTAQRIRKVPLEKVDGNDNYYRFQGHNYTQPCYGKCASKS